MNDNGPKFILNEPGNTGGYVFSLDENKETGFLVGRVEAFDDDISIDYGNQSIR